MFMTITNRIGDRGSPCLRPVFPLKYPDVTPLMLMENDGEQQFLFELVKL